MSSPKRRLSSTLRCPIGMSLQQLATILTFRYENSTLLLVNFSLFLIEDLWLLNLVKLNLILYDKKLTRIGKVIYVTGPLFGPLFQIKAHLVEAKMLCTHL